MFENFIVSLKYKFAKSTDNPQESTLPNKSILTFLKPKTFKPETLVIEKENSYNHDVALSPRATTGDCATTEIEWPLIIDNNPNILDRFTSIVKLDSKVSFTDNVCLIKLVIKV